MLQRLILVLLGLQTAYLAQGQAVDPVVRIDRWSRKAMDIIPFDQPFYLILPVDSTLTMDQVYQLSLYKKNKGDNTQILPFPLASYENSQIKANGGRIFDSAGSRYLRVHITERLLPNTPFSVILYLTGATFYFSQLDKIDVELYQNDPAAKKDYHDLTATLFIKHSHEQQQILWPRFDATDTDRIYSHVPGIQPYRQYFIDSLFDSYNVLFDEDTAILNRLETISDTLKSVKFTISNLFKGDFRKDPQAAKLLSNSSHFLTILENLLNVDSVAPYFASGKLNIQDFEVTDTLDDNDVAGRVANLKKLLQAIDTISFNFHLSLFMATVPDSIRSGIYNTCLGLKPLVKSRIKNLSDAAETIRKRLNANAAIFGGELSFGASAPIGEDLQTSSGHFFIPDLGLANCGTFVGRQFGYVVRPYLGVNISFIPINKQVPIDSIAHRKLLHRLSAVVGLTTTPMTRQGTGDLINTMSLVTGIGYRLSRGFRITTGILIYKRNSANPVLPQQVTVGPMLAASLDLDVANWFTDLKNLIF